MDERQALDMERTEGPCADARSQAESTCSEAARLNVAAQEAAVVLQGAMRDLSEATVALEDAEAADNSRRVADAKLAARTQYRRHLGAATTVMERQRAVTAWWREIDRINGRSRSADVTLERAHAVCVARRQAMSHAERLADARRIRAEVAAQACVQARQRLAICEEQAGATPLAGAVDALLAMDRLSAGDELADEDAPIAGPARANVPGQTADVPGAAVVPSEPQPMLEPLVAERLFEGDRPVLRWLAHELAEMTGRPPSHFLLLLQELVEAVQMAAADRRLLAFDEEHPLWGQFSQGDCRTIARALSDLGFRYDPRDGWFGGRVPAANDLAIAIAYAGFDTRQVRGLPATPDGYRALASGISAAPLELIRASAPELTIRQLVEILGPRADGFDDLWDDWGRVRPLLLTEASAASTP